VGDYDYGSAVTTKHVTSWVDGRNPINGASQQDAFTDRDLVQGCHDFNNDCNADILWQNNSTGQRVIWLMNGTTFQSSVSLGTVPTSWSIAGSGDFNGDGKSDILWQNSSTGQRVIWLMNGTTHQSSVSLGTVPTSWSIRNH